MIQKTKSMNGETEIDITHETVGLKWTNNIFVRLISLLLRWSKLLTPRRVIKISINND